MKKILLFVIFFIFVHAEIIKVGTGNAYAPFAYIDEGGHSAGFDIEVLKLISKIDPSLEFQFYPQSFNTLFVGLDGKKFDMLAHQITSTPEREEKYLFSEPYFFGELTFIVRAGNDTIKSLEDLRGKKLGGVVGSNQAYRIEKFAKSRADWDIKLVHYKNYGALFLALHNGQIDALLDGFIVAEEYAKAQGLKIKDTKISLQKSSIYFLFRKDSSKLRDRISKALEQLRQNGELKALSLSFFRTDYTSKDTQ